MMILKDKISLIKENYEKSNFDAKLNVLNYALSLISIFKISNLCSNFIKSNDKKMI